MRCKYCGKQLGNPCDRATEANRCANAPDDVTYKDKPKPVADEYSTVADYKMKIVRITTEKFIAR